MKKQDITFQPLGLTLDASSGMGDILFLAISRVTPILNINLLKQRTFSGKRIILLTWRADNFYPIWHLPSRIPSFRESTIAKIAEVTDIEVESQATEARGPIASSEIFNSEHDVGGHFISLLLSVNLESCPEFKERTHEESSVVVTVNWLPVPPENKLKKDEIYVGYF